MTMPPKLTRDLRRMTALAVVALVVIAGVAAPAAADTARQPSPTSGSWLISDVGGARVLTWHSPTPLPAGGAVPEFRIDDQLLGYPTVSRRPPNPLASSPRHPVS